MNNSKTNMKLWSNALLDCAMVDKASSKDVDKVSLQKLVKQAAIPSWNSNVHSYRF